MALFNPVVHWAEDENREGAEKTQWSNFWIMINTNKAGEDVYERSFFVGRMRQIIDQIFGQRRRLMNILHVVEESGDYTQSDRDRMAAFRKIERVESEAVVEVGPKVHRVHAHVLLMVQHKTRVQVNVQELRDQVRELSMEGGHPLFGNPVVRIKLIRENPLNAIRKYQRGYKSRIPSSLVNKVLRKPSLRS